ncbi:MAG: DUF2254 domain-containing protein [Phormidesmis sp.]
MSKLLDSLRSGFWFVPMVMIAAALFLASVLVAVDRTMQVEGITILGELFPKGTQSASTLLSAIATSLLTVTGSVFSIAIVAIQLASGQFGPRMLRDFMQDRSNQITFGVCSATFVYTIAVLWAVEDSKNISFTPQISVFVSLLLTIVSVCVLVFFVHNIANAVHADNLIARIGRDLEGCIDRLFPEREEETNRLVWEVSSDFESKATAMLATHSGYIQQIDTERLKAIASQHNLVLKVLYRPGQFVVQNSVLFYAQSKTDLKLLNRNVLGKQLDQSISRGNQRKPKHDVEFPIKQLVEIAIRAISPAVNDPFTAVRCIDRLSVSLCYVLQKAPQKTYLFDSADALRVIVEPTTFEILTNAAFDQIRQYGQTDVAVTIRLLEAMSVIARQTHTETQRGVLRRQVEMVNRSGQNSDNIPEENDRQDILYHYQAAIRELR